MAKCERRAREEVAEEAVTSASSPPTTSALLEVDSARDIPAESVFEHAEVALEATGDDVDM